MQTPISNVTVYKQEIIVLLFVAQLFASILNMGGWAVTVAQLDYFMTHGDEIEVLNISGVLEVVDHPQNFVSGSLAFAGVTLAVSLLFLVSRIIEVILYARSKLTPTAYFGFELPRFVIWTIFFATSLSSVGSGVSIQVVFTIVAWVLDIFSLAYASFVFKRFRSGYYDGLNTHHAQHTESKIES